MPAVDKYADLIYWAHETLTLPSQDSDVGSGSDSSSNCDSDEEEDNQHETIANHGIVIHRFDFSEKFHSQGIDGD